MKAIKIITTLVLGLSFLGMNAQETVKVPLSSPQKDARLKMGIISGSITVVGYNGKEVIVTGKSRSSKKTPKKNKYGLKKISNKALDFSVEEFDNTVIVKSGLGGTTDFEIKVPKKCSLKLSTLNDGFIKVVGVSGIIEVSNINGKIMLKDISGSVSADALNEDIVVNFLKVTPNTAMAFSNLSGNIDVTFPKSIKANVKLKSDMGEIYTDFDIKSTKRKQKVNRNSSKEGTYSVHVEKWILGTINGGGPELLFKNFNGDIVIRAK